MNDMTELSASALAELRELLDDALACGRLTNWEQEFRDSVAEKLAAYGEAIRLSPKQREALERIRAKVYACG